uniref:HORMA domain-containing protein n=1 Tax=Angiostrongylus cantonensis TaxID=6313 RepID=A0A0K0D2A1_ANGCA
MPIDLFCKMGIAGKLHVFVMNPSELLGARLVQKFQGVTEALEQRYLRELMLVVSPTEEDWKDAIEMYTWIMRYDVDGEPQAELQQPDGTVMAALRFRGMQHLKKQTTELLLSLKALCVDTLPPLPAGASAVIRITYTDRTPKGYQAPGFYRSPEDPVLRPDARHVQLATLETDYHGASVVVRSVFIDDEYDVKMKVNNALRLSIMDDSLNDSLNEESCVDDGTHRSVNNDTIERISETALHQSESVEIAREEVRTVDETRSRSSPRIPDSDSSKLTRLSMAVDRGSVADLDSSDNTSPAENYPKRSRRGRHAATKVGQDHPIHRRLGSAASTTPQVVNVSTPRSRNPVIDSYDTPPAKKTPGATKCAWVTPKEPPVMRRK